MNRLTENKIVLVTRRTRLDDLVARFNTVGQAKFYVEHLGADFSDYQHEHEQYRASVAAAIATLERIGRLHVLDRSFLPSFIFGNDDTVVVLGQDGLVANTVKYTTTQQVVGVNPDPARWEGVLLPFGVPDLEKILPEVFARRRSIKEVTMAKAELNDGQKLYAVNDLFVGVRSHVSARYTISVGDKSEQHSSSGLIVSTGLGSTGWFRSLMTGAAVIANEASGGKLHAKPPGGFAWDADYLYFTVREPFPSKTSSATLVFGKITSKRPLKLISQTPEVGVIFSDGIESDFVAFNSGTRATITIAEKRGHLVV
ncbi:MAG TPA: sugar kinase [Blastocatellia bacterium]|nr:sugar kinase [Blastocatellia bacterium]